MSSSKMSPTFIPTRSESAPTAGPRTPPARPAPGVAAVQSWPELNVPAILIHSAAGVEVGVVEHDDRRLAAQLEVHPLQRVGGVAWAISLPVSTSPVSDTMPTSGCRTMRVAGRHAVAGDHVEHAGREHLGLGDQLGQPEQRSAASISDGLMTTQLPAARAGPSFQAAMYSG